ncbi:hypothetical protein JCM21900_003433 [Sporobolomyces salmonicolor]
MGRPLPASEVLGGSDWTHDQGKDTSRMGSRRRVTILICLAVGILLLGERSWNWSSSLFAASDGLQQGTFDSAKGKSAVEQARVDPGDSGLQVANAHDHRPLPQHGHAPPLPPGAGPPPPRPPPPELPNDKMVKLPIRPADQAAPAPPSHDLELTSATDPDAWQRFILVGWMGEQETKAQAHLYQLGLLALALNRTLVLPGVKRSRFGTCYSANPFSLYYAADSLDTFNIPYITSDDFFAWTERQRSPPSAQSITLARGDPVPAESVSFPPDKMCLSAARLDWAKHEPQAYFSSSNDWKNASVRAQFAEQVVGSLLRQDDPDSMAVSSSSSDSPSSSHAPSVLVFQFNLRYPFLTPSSIATLSPYAFPTPRPYTYFPYSPHWTALGHSIAQNLSPYVAIHWRTETLDVDRIAPCGQQLVHKLREIREKHPEVKTLYLATDYPLELLRDGRPHAEGDVMAHSGTMGKTLTPAHHDAMRSFLDALERSNEAGEEGRFRLTTFLEEQRRVPLPQELRELLPPGSSGLEDLDGAIVGIVDKIVLSEAELFYAGLPVSGSPRDGCAKMSQFTTQVESRRSEAFARSASEEEQSSLWNVVGHFSMDGRDKR